MKNELRPICLDGYDVFGELTKWRRSGSSEQKRDWSIRYFKGTSTHDNYECYLTWRFGQDQIGGIRRVHPSPEEATETALREFSKWEREYYALMDHDGGTRS